jgi:hypothetical protein
MAKKEQDGAERAEAPILPLKQGSKLLIVGPNTNATTLFLGNYNGHACANGGDCLPSLSQWIDHFNHGGDGDNADDIFAGEGAGASSARMGSGIANTTVIPGVKDACTNDTAMIKDAVTALNNGGFDAVVLALGGDCHEGEGTDR